MHHSWEPELPLTLGFSLMVERCPAVRPSSANISEENMGLNWLSMGLLFSVCLVSPLPLPFCHKAWWKSRKCSWVLPTTGFIYFHKGVKFSSTNHQYFRAMAKPRVGEESSLSLKALFIVKSSPQKIWCLINWSLLCFKSFLQPLQKKI